MNTKPKKKKKKKKRKTWPRVSFFFGFDRLLENVMGKQRSAGGKKKKKKGKKYYLALSTNIHLRFSFINYQRLLNSPPTTKQLRFSQLY
jgi:hypothetical protein